MAADKCVQLGRTRRRPIEIPRGSHFTEPEAQGASDARAAAKSSRANLYVYVKKALEEAGQTCLEEWLALPFQNDPPRNEFLLKLFFGRDVPLSVSIAHVRDCQEKNWHMLAALTGFEELMRKQSSPNPHAPFWTLTLELGITLTRAALDFVRDISCRSCSSLTGRSTGDSE
jgi:hypothetical protein